MQIERFISFGNEKIRHLFGRFFGQRKQKDFSFFGDMLIQFFQQMFQKSRLGASEIISLHKIFEILVFSEHRLEKYKQQLLYCFDDC